MLFDNGLRGQSAGAETGNASESIGDAPCEYLTSKTLHRAVSKQFEHEFHPVGQVQVVQSDMNFIDSLQRQNRIDLFNGFGGLYQQTCFGPAGHQINEFRRFVDGFEIRQHNHVGSVADDRINLRPGAGMDRIGSDKQFRAVDRIAHDSYVVERMV